MTPASQLGGHEPQSRGRRWDTQGLGVSSHSGPRHEYFCHSPALSRGRLVSRQGNGTHRTPPRRASPSSVPVRGLVKRVAPLHPHGATTIGWLQVAGLGSGLPKPRDPPRFGNTLRSSTFFFSYKNFLTRQEERKRSLCFLKSLPSPLHAAFTLN